MLLKVNHNYESPNPSEDDTINKRSFVELE